MTLGQTPYVDIDPFEMAAYLKDGYRIAQPINCPDELWVSLSLKDMGFIPLYDRGIKEEELVPNFIQRLPLESNDSLDLN